MLTGTEKKNDLGILAHTWIQIVHIFQILIEKNLVSGVCHAPPTYLQVNEDSHYFLLLLCTYLRVLHISPKSCTIH